MALAISIYRKEQAKPDDGHRKMGYRKACDAAQKAYFQQHRVTIKLNHNTLRNLTNGLTMPKAEFNMQKRWLSVTEEEEVIGYVVETAAWGFGLDHLRLKEHVDEICRARYGSRFPKEGVGKQWTHRFVERHSNRLHVYIARPLHDVRGKAANPEMNKLWYDIVEENQMRGDDGKPVAPECTWAMDEGGFQANGDEGGTKIIGAKGKKVQYQQQAGSRETTTVLVTIGGHGGALPPAVIFAGKGYLVKWKQDNPANAS